MINGKKIVVVLPAFKAEKTLEKTFNNIPHDIVDSVILVDDASDDETLAVAERLAITTYTHEGNLGYGANQKNLLQRSVKVRSRHNSYVASRLPI